MMKNRFRVNDRVYYVDPLHGVASGNYVVHEVLPRDGFSPEYRIYNEELDDYQIASNGSLTKLDE